MSREISLEERLRYLGRYIVRNPYTGASSLDVEGILACKEARKLFADIWDAGYDGGFQDGEGDSYVSEQHINPFK